MDREGCLPVGKPLPVGGCVTVGVFVGAEDDESDAVGEPCWLVAKLVPDIVVVEFIGIRVLL